MIFDLDVRFCNFLYILFKSQYDNNSYCTFIMFLYSMIM